MKNECSIVCDILPLYTEDMLSPETAEFVRKHIDGCSDCMAEYKKIQFACGDVEKIAEEALDREKNARPLIDFKNKIRSKIKITVAVVVVFAVVVCAVAYRFPVYRIADMLGKPYLLSDYSTQEVLMLGSTGNVKDRIAVQPVYELAQTAFSDCKHSYTENVKLYGPFSVYAVASELGADHIDYELRLLSVHLEKTTGYMWVWYEQKGIAANGETVCGRWDILSLWEVVKDDSGEWHISCIREHA